MGKVYKFDPHIKKKMVDESIKQLLKWNFKKAFDRIKDISKFPDSLRSKMGLLMEYYGDLDQTRKGKVFKKIPKKIELLINDINEWQNKEK